jgi:hypothetical protein
VNYKTEYKELLNVIIEDLRVCINYTPNRENDLLCFMEQYLKAEADKRPGLLKEIQKCIEGKIYKNPFHAYYHYSEKEIEKLSNILNDYIKNMHSETEKGMVLSNVIVNINEMHDRSYGQLIDGWRSERLVEFLVLVAKEVYFPFAFNTIQEQKRW